MQSEILKYHRVQESLPEILSNDKITSASIELNSIVLGTEDGYVHVLSFNGKLLKSIKAHDRPVNDISVDGSGLTIASCSDNGTVVVSTVGLGVDDKDVVVHFNQSMKAVCIENDSAAKKDKSFIVGSVTGQLIYHRTVWFSQKNVILFNGADSAVTSIAWRGNIVAWGDATQVRLMDLGTQSAICFLNCPQGVSVHSPLPCCLFWESESDLLIGWADSVRHVELSSASGGVGNADIITARSVVDWETDCIVCGISSFDADHIAILGYAPPLEGELGTVISLELPSKSKPASTSLKNTESASSSQKSLNCTDTAVVSLSQPEIQVILRSTGELVFSDLLVLNNETMGGPSSFRLLSTYNCVTHSRDAQKWRLGEIRETCPRGGLRGLAPTLFVVSPQDFVVARVRDVNDYIKKALDDVDLKLAVELAAGDRLSLRAYRYADLVTLYLEDLLDRDKDRDGDRDRPRERESDGPDSSSRNSDNCDETNSHKNNDNNKNINKVMLSPKNNYLTALTAQKKRVQDPCSLAASECHRLVGDDPVLWERWVYAFAKRRCLHHISPFIPISNPRLPNTVYEVVLESFLYSDSKAFLEVIKNWSVVTPPLFNHQVLLQRLRSKNSSMSPSVIKDSLRVQKWDLVESQAQLLIVAREHEEALNCYLEMNILHTARHGDGNHNENENGCECNSPNNNGSRNNSNNGNSINSPHPGVTKHTYRHVFELIERESMYDIVRDKIVQLVHLSKEHSARLLVKHVQKLPPALVVSQLKSEPSLLHWYLNTLFTRIPEQYNTQPEYAEYHTMQIPLHAKYAPSLKRQEKERETNQKNSNNKFGSKPNDTNINLRKSFDPEIIHNSSSPVASSSYSSSTPSLHTRQKTPDSEFLHFLKNSKFVHLDLALKECEKRKPPLYLEMIFILGKLGKTKDALCLLLREVQDVSTIIEFVENHDKLLWEDLVEHSLKQASLKNWDFLSSLLDHLGSCSLNPIKLISQIEKNTEIPHLRLRLLKIIQLYNFEVSLNTICNSSLEEDTLSSQRSLNQGRRRAMKVEPTLRCAGCSRPLFMPAPSAPIRDSAAISDSNNASNDSSDVNNHNHNMNYSNSTANTVNKFNTAGINKENSIKKTNMNDGKIFINNKTDAMGKIWGNSESGAGPSGLVVHLSKLAYHMSCYEKIRK